MNSTTSVVVDTDVISFLFKAHSLAPAYQAILAGRSLAVSLITLAEIEYGMEAKNWGSSRRDLTAAFSHASRRSYPIPKLPARGRGSSAVARGKASQFHLGVATLRRRIGGRRMNGLPPEKGLQT
jgi:predicted nucleic acid-binding protein